MLQAGVGHFPDNQSLSLRPTWWKEKMDSCGMSSDLHMHAHTLTHYDK